MTTFEAGRHRPEVRSLARQDGGALIAVIGTTLVAGAARGPAAELRYLGAATATVLACVDSIYVARRRIWPVYLLDAVVELGILAGWAALWPSQWSRPGRG
jgi:hypothetical protein